MTRDSRGGRSVVCPERRCRAAVGDPCFADAGSVWLHRKRSHPARITAARNKSKRGQLKLEETKTVKRTDELYVARMLAQAETLALIEEARKARLALISFVHGGVSGAAFDALLGSVGRMKPEAAHAALADVVRIEAEMKRMRRKRRKERGR